jgi:hypothetical protein
MADVLRPANLRRQTPTDELAIAEDIDRLLTGDFDAYPTAGRRLIRRGEPVIPYLGHAALRHPAPAAHKERLAIAYGPVLDALPPERVLVALASPYAATRVAAATSAGERRLEPLGQRLIELLEDPDIHVRRAAITSLRMISGEFIGYRATDSPSERAAAARQWQEYWLRR